MAYYYGFLFTIIVNSIMWYVISYLVANIITNPKEPMTKNILFNMASLRYTPEIIE
jgi:ABC-type uncharacterized transport system permease subunit